MRVKILKPQSAVIDKLSTKNWPVDWEGEVADEVLAQWKEGEDYAALEPLPVKVELTDEQKAVLAAAADQAMAAAREIEQAAAEQTTAPDAEAIGAATVTELRAMAIARGVSGAARMTKPQLLQALLIGG